MIADLQKHIVSTKYGPLVVVFTAADAARVRTLDVQQDEPDEAFTVNGIRLKVDGQAHPSGACQRNCWAHADGQRRGQWAWGQVSHRDDMDSSVYGDGEVSGYTTAPTVKRYGGGVFAPEAPRKGTETAAIEALAAVNTVAFRARESLVDGERHKRAQAVQRAAKHAASVRAELDAALAAWQAAEDRLAELDSAKSEAA